MPGVLLDIVAVVVSVISFVGLIALTVGCDRL